MVRAAKSMIIVQMCYFKPEEQEIIFVTVYLLSVKFLSKKILYSDLVM